MLPNRALTKNFWLYELSTRQPASQYTSIEQVKTRNTVAKNLESFYPNTRQPLRSQHLTGHAADIQDFKHGNEYLFRKIIDLKLPFDQIINEFNFDWVHVSYDPARNRRKVTEAYRDENGMTRYRPYVLKNAVNQ